ncbi:acetyl-CoA carboxylase biotin carboxylase subunit family protein [Mesorhizobium opportunistum]|uniref:ATP-grasp domain-containing protein n=1 Tax=Mesorhizobium opportunistum TaxID=593909 RepID=UPI00333D1401
MVRRALILVEGHSRGNGLLYVQAAQRLGLHPITLSADPAQYDYLESEKVKTIHVDTDNLDALIHECSRLRTTYDIAGITGFSGVDESVYATVSKLCRHFDLPGPNPASIERCCDKFAQRQFLAQAGVPVPAYRLATNAKDVESSAAEIGLPVIVKPAVGSGSRGVRLCRDVNELAEHTTFLLGGKYIWPSSPRILVEEFAQGPFYCAEIMGNEVIGIDAADWGRPPHFVCHATIFPALLTDEEHDRIADFSKSCLQALGLGWGPTNVEFRWTKLGPVVIEVNPRLAGAPNPQLVQLACGVDLITEHIKLVIGDELNLRRRHSYSAAARYLFPDRDGTLDWIRGDRQAAALSGVAEVKLYVKANTPIVRRGDSRDSMGHVVAVSPNLAQTEAILQRAVHLMGWWIKPFPNISEQEQPAAVHLVAGAK